MFYTCSLALLVVFGCIFAILGIAREPAPLTLSAQANVSFTGMLNKNLHKLDSNTCDARCYAKGAFDIYVRCRTGTQQ